MHQRIAETHYPDIARIASLRTDGFPCIETQCVSGELRGDTNLFRNSLTKFGK